jgi:hypothetical protein
MEMTNNPETMDEEESRTPFEGFVFHQRRALEETGKALEALLPEGFRTHGTNASKEFTEGFRVLIDAAMKELKKTRSGEEPAGDTDEGDEPGAASSTGKSKVKIPVD